MVLEEPRQPEASRPSFTSVPVSANGTNDHAIEVHASKLSAIHMEDADYDARLEKMSPQYDEYTILLKKHLGVVEGELSRLKARQRSVFSVVFAIEEALMIITPAPKQARTAMYSNPERVQRICKHKKPEYIECHHGNGEKSKKNERLI